VTEPVRVTASCANWNASSTNRSNRDFGGSASTQNTG